MGRNLGNTEDAIFDIRSITRNFFLRREIGIFEFDTKYARIGHTDLLDQWYPEVRGYGMQFAQLIFIRPALVASA